MTIPKAIATCALPALICGALLGYMARPEAPKPPTPPQEKPAQRPRQQATDEAALGRLRARIRDLESQLAAATASNSVANAEETKAEPESERPRNPFFRNGPPRMPTAAEMREHMEELRKADPERYAQMTNNFARWHARRLKRSSDRLDILASVDTSRLSEKELKTHEELQDAIVRREELREMLNPQNEDVTEEQRKKTFEELRELDQKMHQLETSERNTLITKTARSYGLSKANAKEMTEAVKAIYEATGGGGGRHWGFGGPPPGGPGGPQR